MILIITHHWFLVIFIFIFYCYIGYSGHVIDAMVYALTLFKLCN